MAFADFIPSREAQIIPKATSFGTQISATPTAFGLVAAQATTFQTLLAAFVAAFNITQNDSTRTPASIVTKNAAKANLIASWRQLAGIIQKCPTVTDAQRRNLGLNVRTSDAPIPVPGVSPFIKIISVTGRTARLQLLGDSSSPKRGKPAGVAGATVFSFIGATRPDDINLWHFEGNTTRTIFDVQFPNTVAAGATVWLTAMWRNPRDQSGPAAEPISTQLAGGVSMAA